jgi:hypothetical protein
MRWLIRMTGDALVLQPADQVQHLGHLPHADRGRGLVHEDDLRVGEPGAGDRHRLALAARHLPDHVARPGLGLQLAEQRGGAGVHGAEVDELERPDERVRSRPRKTFSAAVRLLQSARSW